MTIVRLAWMDDGECLDSDPEAWAVNEALSKENRAAIRLCRRCGVRAECEDYGRRTGASGVILGGRHFPARTNTSRRIEVNRCVVCENEFEALPHPKQTYCSRRCREKAWRGRARANREAA